MRLFKSKQELFYLDSIFVKVRSVLSNRRSCCNKPRLLEAARKNWVNTAEIVRMVLQHELCQRSCPGVHVPAVDSTHIETLSDKIKSVRSATEFSRGVQAIGIVQIPDAEIIAMLAEVINEDLKRDGQPEMYHVRLSAGSPEPTPVSSEETHDA